MHNAYLIKPWNTYLPCVTNCNNIEQSSIKLLQCVKKVADKSCNKSNRTFQITCADLTRNMAGKNSFIYETVSIEKMIAVCCVRLKMLGKYCIFIVAYPPWMSLHLYFGDIYLNVILSLREPWRFFATAFFYIIISRCKLW